jgi:hypothetical protein
MQNIQTLDHDHLLDVCGGGVAEAFNCAKSTAADAGLVTSLIPGAQPSIPVVSGAGAVIGFFGSLISQAMGGPVCPTSVSGYQGPAPAQPTPPATR